MTSSMAPGKNSSTSSFSCQRSSRGSARPWLAAAKAWPWTTSGGVPALIPARTASVWSRMGPLSTTTRTLSWKRSKSRTASRKGAVTQSSVMRTRRVVGVGEPPRRRTRRPPGRARREPPAKPCGSEPRAEQTTTPPAGARRGRGEVVLPPPSRGAAVEGRVQAGGGRRSWRLRRVVRVGGGGRARGGRWWWWSAGGGRGRRLAEVDDHVLALVDPGRVGDQAGAVGGEGPAVAGVDELPGGRSPLEEAAPGGAGAVGLERPPVVAAQVLDVDVAGPVEQVLEQDGTAPGDGAGPVLGRARRRRWRPPSRACRRRSRRRWPRWRR